MIEQDDRVYAKVEKIERAEESVEQDFVKESSYTESEAQQEPNQDKKKKTTEQGDNKKKDKKTKKGDKKDKGDEDLKNTETKNEKAKSEQREKVRLNLLSKIKENPQPYIEKIVPMAVGFVFSTVATMALEVFLGAGFLTRTFGSLAGLITKLVSAAIVVATYSKGKEFAEDVINGDGLELELPGILDSSNI